MTELGDTVQGTITVTPAKKDGITVSEDQNLTLEGVAGRILDHKIKGALNKVLSYIITAAVVGLAGIVLGISHELNGKISEAVGKQSTQQQFYESKINDLQRQVDEQKRQLHYYQCIDDKRVKDKAGCYR